MGWRTIGTVSHTDSDGTRYDRRVARNDSTGDTERTFGTGEHMISDKTSRSVGNTSSDAEAMAKASSDLKSTF